VKQRRTPRWTQLALDDTCPVCWGRGRDRYGSCDRCDGTGRLQVEDLEVPDAER